jgi:metal-responsive CopG/Arc/MetJ family transcriptional regulator
MGSSVVVYIPDLLLFLDALDAIILNRIFQSRSGGFPEMVRKFAAEKLWRNLFRPLQMEATLRE